MEAKRRKKEKGKGKKKKEKRKEKREKRKEKREKRKKERKTERIVVCTALNTRIAGAVRRGDDGDGG